MNYQRYNKAIVAVIVAVVFALLNQFGLTDQSTLKDVIEVLVAGLGVYMVPNQR